MRVFVVNLEQSVDRKLFMKSQLDQLNISHEFFPAVDGRRLSPEQMEQMCNMEVVRAWPDLLTPGMIGCSLSHYHVYKKMVADKIEMAFILEDDTRLSQHLPIVLNEVKVKLKTGTLDLNEPILLYYQSEELVEFAQYGGVTLSNNFAAHYPVDIWRPITTAAYIISLSCAQKLVDLIYPIRYSPDSWAVYHREGAIGGLRCILPLPVESGFFKSDIGYEQNKPINRLIKYLESKSIFPVVQLLKWRRKNRAKQQNRFYFSNSPLNWKIIKS